MTLLTICQEVSYRTSQAKPSLIVGESGQYARELLSFAQQAGRGLMRAVDWEALTSEHSFTTVAADAQTSSIPSDWDRFVDGSMFNRTTEREIHGPITTQEWQQRKAFETASTIDYWFRVRGGSILIAPQPTAGESVYYEYISKNWATAASDGAAQAKFETDGDGHIFPDDELLILSIMWRWLKHKGLEWESVHQQYAAEVASYQATQKGAPVLNLADRASSFNRVNVPEGNWS